MTYNPVVPEFEIWTEINYIQKIAVAIVVSGFRACTCETLNTGEKRSKVSHFHSAPGNTMCLVQNVIDYDFCNTF